MFLLFMISLSIIVYFICMELGKPVQPEPPFVGECPGCDEQVESGWLVCPKCRTILRETCQECGKVHDLWASYCPWCGHPNQKAAT